MRLPSQKEIDAERNALREKIAVGKQAEKDLAKLEESIKSIATLVKESKGEIIAYYLDSGTMGGNRPKRRFSPLASIAEAAIRSHGKLHIDELMKKMTELGWVSAGDYKLDMKNVFNSLAVNKKFTNLGRNTWDLTENVKKQEVQK